MAISPTSFPPPQQSMREVEIQDPGAKAREFIVRLGIPVEGIRKVELKKYYDGWEVMCGNLQPRWTPHVEIKYLPGEVMAIGKFMSFTIESEIEGMESLHFAQVIVEELRKHIPEGQVDDFIPVADAANRAVKDTFGYLKYVHRYNNDESEYGMLVARSLLPSNETFWGSSLVFYYAGIGMYTCCACACMPIVDKD